MLDGNADGDLAGSRFVERIAVGIAALIDCGAGSVANTGQHRVLASELEIRLVIGIYDRMRCLGERYDLHGTGLRLREANLHAAGVVGDELPEEDNNIVKGTNMSQIATALDYMNKHYSESIKAGELSELCNMSETHFRRLFESYINMPPMEYLNLIRVQKACELMKKTNEPMELIAQKCGFTTQSTFNRNFRKFLDTSPYQWKINPENYEHKLLNFRISALKGW